MGMSKEQVLVTGGLGYLGSVLCQHLLRAGYGVTVIDNFGSGRQGVVRRWAGECFRFVPGDARDEGLMRTLVREADAIVPLAAVVGAPACARLPGLARTVNLEAIRLLNRLRSPAQLVVFPGTECGYGIHTGAHRCTEETNLQPASLYARLKVEAEAELLGSPNTISLRLCTLFGPSPRMRLDSLVHHFVHAAVRNAYLQVFEESFKRNFVHIRDVAECIVHCIDKATGMRGHAFNVGNETMSVSKEELAAKIKRFVPRLSIHFSPAGTDPDQRNYTVSSGKLEATGFQVRCSLDRGIEELVAWYRRKGENPLRRIW